MPNEIITAVYAQHTALLQRVGASQGDAVTPFLVNIENGVQRIFNRYRDRAKTAANQVVIQDAINELTRTELQEYIVELKKDQRAIGKNEGEFAASTLDDVVETEGFIAKVPSSSQIATLAIATPIQLSESSFTTYNTMMRKYWQGWTDEIDALVQNGFVTGETINEIAEGIFNQMRLERNPVSKNTLMRARRSARQVAITGTNHYANTARIAFVEDNDDVLIGYRLISVIDSRTSQKCRSLDQKIIKANDPKLSQFTPPLHRGCRTALVYEVDDRFKLDRKDTQRASSFEVDGKRDPKPVSSEGIYYEKMKMLKASDQDAILGKRMGKAFRKLNNPSEFAKLTIDSLGNPISIKDMIKRDNDLGAILRKQNKT